MHILTITSLFPDSVHPYHAVFVRSRMEAFIKKHGHQLTVIAPVPFYPNLPFGTVKTYDDLARVPSVEDPWGYPIYHPRYFILPFISMRYHGRLMAAAVKATTKKIHGENPVDIVDGHYIYPDGSAALTAGKLLGVPIVLSARGTDLNLFPTIDSIKDSVIHNISQADALICVSDALKKKAEALHKGLNRCHVVSNGINERFFYKTNRQKARAEAGLPVSGKIILSVGNLVTNKGIDKLIEAFGKLGSSGNYLVIIGNGPERKGLESLCGRLKIDEKVLFLGPIANEYLGQYYNAADLFVLPSAREGWPNVLCEAQACGLPIVSSDVGGAGEIVRHEWQGRLVKGNSPGILAEALTVALDTNWDRDKIAESGKTRTWSNVADDLEALFQSVKVNYKIG